MSAVAQPVLSGPSDHVLRPFEASDAPALTAAYAVPDIQQWHMAQLDSTEEAAAWIDRWRAEWPAETGANWVIADPDTGRLLGRAALRGVRLTEGHAEISYWVIPDARGRGLAGSAVDTLMTWSFTTLGLHRLEVNHAVDNRSSCRVATKAGFELEGTRRSALLHVDGWHDMHLHARIASG